jgi:hypothetical protein
MDDKLARWVEMKRWNNACFFAMVVMFYAFKRHPPSILVIHQWDYAISFLADKIS